MNKIILVLLLLCGVARLPVFAQATNESTLIQVLQSNATPAEKEAACLRLKQIGTIKSVPALAALLADEHLYQSACDVLETMPTTEAGQALQAALKPSAGKAKAGIIHTLGERRFQPAISELVPLLSDADPLIATAAARALGRMGATAIAPLQSALSKAVAPVRAAIVDALLASADQLLADRKKAEAQSIYRQFNTTQEKENVRMSAYAGMIRSDETQAQALITAGLTATDPAQQAAALRLAHGSKDSKATATFTNLLTQVAPPLQMALVRLLQQRGDAAAFPAVFALAQKSEGPLRVMALSAVGTLGDASAISVLAQAATATDEAEQKTARQALIDLRRGEIAEAMLAQLATARPAVQVELIRALTARRDKTSAPKLLEMAQSKNDSARRAALRGLERLADGSHLPTLVKLLEAAPDDDTRAEVQSVFEALADRTPATQKINVSSLAQALTTKAVPTRIALLQVSAFFADPKLREAFQAALKDSDPQVRNAAARALCNSRDVKLLPDLLELARTSSETNVRALALGGYVRLVGEGDTGFVTGKRAQLLMAAFQIATRPEEKRLILSTLATTPNLESLLLVSRAGVEPEIKPEAEVAALRIAQALLPTEPTAATSVLQQLAKSGGTPQMQTSAQSILKQFDSGWICTGPYRRKGLDNRALFDVVFAPEKRGTNEIIWRRAPGTADLARPGEVDLLAAAERNNVAVYAKTRVFVPTAQPVIFEIGSDDGIKLWVNDAVIHTNNTTRGIVPGEDRVKGKLRAGWNDLFAKITQGTAGCGFILTIKNPEGGEIPGLRFDPNGKVLTGFKKIQLSDQFYAEGATAGDFNRDGKMDVVAGPYWFAGPDFKEQHEIRPPKKFDPLGYSDNFLSYTGDFNGDGWLDVFCVPFPGAEGFWYENPQGNAGHWPKHLAYPMVGNESPGWVDVNGDGRPDLIFNNDDYLGYATYDPTQPNALWKFHAVSPKDKKYQRFTHGIGADDLNGDGRVDLVESAGWWEQPADLKTDAPWKFHPYQFAEAASQMLVTDVDGDGLADVINAWHCHRYGILWNRQWRSSSGEIKWEQRVIMPPVPDLNVATLRFSQLHAMTLADMNGDGLPDVVTGKRYWAHGPAGDVEPDAPAVLYWFELKRGRSGVEFVPHQIDDNSGVGTQVSAVDLNGDQKPDVIVGNKKGIFVHMNDSTGQTKR